MIANTTLQITEVCEKEYAIEIEQLIKTLSDCGLNIEFSDITRASKERRNSNCAD